MKNNGTRTLIKHLRQDENLPELVHVSLLPACIKALHTVIEEECAEGALPAWCKNALDDSSVDWCAVLQAVLRWK